MNLPKPAEIMPLDPDEFIGAYQYAGMVAEFEFLEEIPGIGKPLIKTDEGTLSLANIPMNRFGLAVARHFRGREDKLQSFFWRFSAFQKLFKHKSMKKIHKRSRE